MLRNSVLTALKRALGAVFIGLALSSPARRSRSSRSRSASA